MSPADGLRGRTGPSTKARGAYPFPTWLRFARRWPAQIVRPLAAFVRRSRTDVCREGFYYVLLTVFVFAGAMLGDVNLLMLLGGMLVGPIWISHRLVAKTLRGLEVVRRIPSGVCAGDLVVVKIELANPRKRLGCWAVVVEEELRREGDDRRADVLRPGAFFSYVPARQTRQRAYRGRLPRRGRYRFAAPTVSTRFPFGLFRREVRIGEPGTLIVYPRLGQLTQQWLSRHREWFEGTHRREHRHGRVSGDFYGVRPWRSGDSQRHIHWRSSARHGTLVVRQFEQHRNRDLAVLLDLWQPEQPQPADLDRIELAVSFAATIVADACRRGGSNLFVGTTADEDQGIHGPASALFAQSVMERLAVVEASNEDRLAQLLRQAASAVEPGTEVLLVTSRTVDVADVQRRATQGVDLHRRSLAPRMRVVSIADPGLEDYFQP